MAKSVGNVMPLHDVLDDVGRNALIMLFVGAHYRQPMAFDDMRLMEALARVARGARGRARPGRRRLAAGAAPPARRVLRRAAPGLQHPAALAAMFDWIKRGQPARRRAGRPRRSRRDALRAGAGRTSPSTAARPAPRSRSCSTSARPPAHGRDYAEADRLRDELRARGLGGPRRRRPGRSSCASSSDPLRPQPRARGAARRAPARSTQVWATERVVAREPWLGQAGARVASAARDRAPRRRT